ncbi:unnamed protein product [Rotaria sordida]|uniref:Uncharacterized protein n=2 Tax=Rotaria sordida TaxID=392033 RepID=A0A814WFH8_9BILA|nr:unnamed protein product [Rotaria sordida]
MQIIKSNFHFSFLILIGCILRPSQHQSISSDWQSSANLSSKGFEFSPIDEQALLLFDIIAKSLISCVKICHSTVPCYIFDFDDQSHRCRIFEGNITTMGSIVASSSSQSRVGSIKLYPEQFTNLGQSCSFCQRSKYLTCINNTCLCPAHTYFNGLICQSQKLLGANCTIDGECRLDLNYICLPRQQCGFASMQTGTIVGGYGNGTGGSTLDALQYPTGLAMGIDNSLYVSDYLNHRVIKLQQGSLMGSIVAGTGVAGSNLNQLNGPTGLYVDTSLNIYIADSKNFRIMFWQRDSSIGVKVAGTGVSGNTLNSFSTVVGLSVDLQGNIYLCDSFNHRIMKFTPNSSDAIIVGGTGVAGNSSYQLNTPCGIYFQDLNSYLYVVDSNNHRIQRYNVDVSTNGTTVAGGNGEGSASNQLNSPYSACVSKITNAIYISDSGNNRIQRWRSGATSGVTIAGNGTLINSYSTSLTGLMDVRLSNNENYLFKARILIMFVRIGIFLIIFIVLVNGLIPSSTIENDLNELIKLHKEFLNRSPIIPARQAYEVRCRAVVECCPDEQENIFTLFSEGQFNEKCLSNGTKTNTSSLSLLCMSTLRQLIQLTKEPIYNRYFQVLGNNTNRFNRIKTWKKQMKMVCSNDELYAFYCERNNIEKFKSCQRKVLKMIAKENIDDDGIIYTTYVSRWEQEYAIDNQKLAKAFPNI